MQYRILGSFYVAADDVEIVVGGGKQRALLVLLLLNANEAVSTDRLIDQLWGESRSTECDEGSPELRLEAAAAARRRRSDHARARLRAPRRAGRARASTVSTRLVADGRRALAGGDPEHAAALFWAEALALWRGPPLARLRLRAVRVGRHRAARRAASGGAGRADRRRPPARPPRRPDPRARVPRRPAIRFRSGFAASSCSRSTVPGRQAEALQVYKEARRVLVDELGIEPSQELQQLECRAILAHDPSLEPPLDREERRGGQTEGSGRGIVSWPRAPPGKPSRSRGSLSSTDAAGKRDRRRPPTAAVGVNRPEDERARRQCPGPQPPDQDCRRHRTGLGVEFAGGTLSEIDPRSLTLASTLAGQ